MSKHTHSSPSHGAKIVLFRIYMLQFVFCTRFSVPWVIRISVAIWWDWVTSQCKLIGKLRACNHTTWNSSLRILTCYQCCNPKYPGSKTPNWHVLPRFSAILSWKPCQCWIPFPSIYISSMVVLLCTFVCWVVHLSFAGSSVLCFPILFTV